MCVCGGGPVKFHAASSGAFLNFDIPVGGWGHGERGKYSKVVFFLYVSCFWFMTIYGLSILALEECGMNLALVHSILFFPIALEGRRGPGMTSQQSLFTLSCFQLPYLSWQV